MDHALILDHYLTRTEPINQVVTIEPPARLIWCGSCSAAHEAAVHHHIHAHHPVLGTR